MYALLVLLVLISFSRTASSGKCALTGVNLSGSEYGTAPGVVFYTYTYPSSADADYFINKGMNVYRIPVLAERYVKYPGGPLVSSEVTLLDNLINYITVTKGKYVLLDPHNFGFYYYGRVGQSSSPISAFADWWSKMANHYKTNNKVIFGIMNEPDGSADPAIWEQAAQASVNAIRNAGATQLVLIPGVFWTGAHSWITSGSAANMINVVDPANNFAFEVHQYLDSDSSGTSSTCVSATIGSQRITDFTNWARTNHVRGFLGEFGGGPNSLCLSALNDTINYMDSNSDVWLGWTYWAGGPWWGEGYFSNLQPNASGIDRAQWPVVGSHLNTTAITLPIPAVPSPSTVPPVTATNTVIYSDSLGTWGDYSWATHSLSNTSPKKSGTYSLSVTFSSYGGLWFKCPTYNCITVGPAGTYFMVELWFNPGTTVSISALAFYLVDSAGNRNTALALGDYFESAPVANQWVKGHFPLLLSTAGSYDGVQIISNTASTLPTMYFDDIALVTYS